MNTVASIVATLLSLIPKDFMKEVLDALFDKIEDKILSSENKWDDKIVLPLIEKARELLDVPDND